MKRVLLTLTATSAAALGVALFSCTSAEAGGYGGQSSVISGRTSPSATMPGTAAPTSRSLDPGTFADLASGIGLVRDFNCAGKPIAGGTGFLVGTSVLMTARHVVRGACNVKVLIDGHWVGVRNTISWFKRGRGDINTADVTTMKLDADASGHVFTIRSWSAGIGKNVAALGHPLGNRISLNQGSVVEKGHIGNVPMLAVRMLAAEGGSGSPLVDDQGQVVGILQIGLGGKDAFGQKTSGAILGIDLPSWWPTAKKDLCKVYRYGGIAGCGKATAPAPSPTSPPSRHYVQSCWIQYTGDSWLAVASTAATTFPLDFVTHDPATYWAVVQLTTPASALGGTVKTRLIQPDGRTFGTSSSSTSAQGSLMADSLDWRFGSDNAPFYQHPELTGQGFWTLEWDFADGESCATDFQVIQN